MFELFKAIGLGLMVLLPLVNPLTTVALFLSLSKNMTAAERNQQARLASVYVFAIMMVAFYAGTLVMNTFGISIPGLRIAGGLIVSFIGFRMLFPAQTDDDSGLAESKARKMHKHKTTNIAFVPLAMPSTAGPGTIAMIISWVSTVNEDVYFSSWVTALAPGLVFLTISVVVWIALCSSGAIMHVIGASAIEAISQLMGFLLVCMGVQFVINGVLEIIADYHA
ncbi:MAG: MarC family NAAT transporter [Sodalis sp. (in: enterobacteria)]|uniref:MarC family NAAT transporter n=1 Tax=Sodalis sp. (in: enterobacteria) TaxID=1898979 RepID=UPI003F3C3A6B